MGGNIIFYCIFAFVGKSRGFCFIYLVYR